MNAGVAVKSSKKKDGGRTTKVMRVPLEIVDQVEHYTKNKGYRIPLFSRKVDCWLIAEEKMTSDIMTIKEVCEYLKLNEKIPYRLATEKKMLDFKVGGSWKFRKGEIDEWIIDQGKNKGEK